MGSLAFLVERVPRTIQSLIDSVPSSFVASAEGFLEVLGLLGRGGPEAAASVLQLAARFLAGFRRPQQRNSCSDRQAQQKPSQSALGSFHNHDGLVTAMVTHISPFSTALRRANALG